tara:strand:+ start:211 stop:756 length:546 start_codon:yes stop_codon:yes gene_type:complete
MAAFTVIEHEEIATGGVVSWSETSIAASYDHLLLKVSGRSERSGAYDDEWKIQLNGSTSTSDYSCTNLTAMTGTPISERYATGVRDGFIKQTVPAALIEADTFGIINMWIPNYANTANFKQILVSNGKSTASTTDYRWAVQQIAGVFHSTAAISQILVTSRSGLGDIAEFSTFTLYGVTGA